MSETAKAHENQENAVSGDEGNNSQQNGTMAPSPPPLEEPGSPSAAASAADKSQKPEHGLLNDVNFKKIEDLRRAIELLKLTNPSVAAAARGAVSAPKTEAEARQKKYQFWDTQPVPKLNESEEFEMNEPIDPNTDISKVPQEPYTLPTGFVWDTLDIESDKELQELYKLLYENYVEDDDNMFRFNYSVEFLKWVLKPPGWNSQWYVGVRVDKSKENKKGKLLGFVSAIPAKVRIYDKVVKSVEINFLCVHKKLRSKRMAPVLIKEITRRVNLTGVWQALYTAGVFIPKPISTCRYYHRSLNPKKLIEVGFSSLTRNMTIPRTVRLYRLPEQPKLAGLRQFNVKKDLKQVYHLLEQHLEKFDLVPLFTQEELAHWITPVPNVMECYVVERPNLEKKRNEIVAFLSFYILPSTVMNHKVHKDVKAGYSFYNVVTSGIKLIELMQDALIIAKNAGLDVFNALNQMDNEEFLQDLKFGSGDGTLNYYVFNWRAKPIAPGKVGVVLQ